MEDLYLIVQVKDNIIKELQMQLFDKENIIKVQERMIEKKNETISLLYDKLAIQEFAKEPENKNQIKLEI